MWEVTTGTCRWVGHTPPTIIRRIEWSPDGTQLASCSDDGSVCLWEASDGRLRASLQGHSSMVESVAWSPDGPASSPGRGSRLASGGGGQGRGEIFIWDVHSGERLQTLRRDRPYERLTITGIRGLSEAQTTTLRALGAIEDNAAPGTQHAP